MGATSTAPARRSCGPTRARPSRGRLSPACRSPGARCAGTRTWAGAAITWSGPATRPRSPAASWRRVPATTPGAHPGVHGSHAGGRRALAPEHVGRRRDLLVGHPAGRDGLARAAGGPASPGGHRDRRRPRAALARGPQGSRIHPSPGPLLAGGPLGERAGLHPVHARGHDRRAAGRRRAGRPRGRSGCRRVPAGDGRCLERRHRALDLRRGHRLARRVGVDGYYLRVAPPDERGEPVKYSGHDAFWYQPSTRGQFVPADIVSRDALAYVRFGLRAPTTRGSSTRSRWSTRP